MPTPHLLPVAHAFYAGQTDLVLLVLDPALLAAPLRFEPPVHPSAIGSSDGIAQEQLFPHLYGPLNGSAILDIVDVARFDGLPVPWLFAALNSVEMPSVPWSLFKFSGDETKTPGREHLDAFLRARLDRMESVLTGREWLAGSFCVADIAMADVLRLVDRLDGLAEHRACRDYVVRAAQRPAFKKAYADQMAHFAAAD